MWSMADGPGGVQPVRPQASAWPQLPHPCGVDDVLQALESLVFAEEDIAYLSMQGAFPDSFLNRLTELRFTGDVYAVPEGTPIFANEPILEVVAPIGEAQLIETLVLSSDDPRVQGSARRSSRPRAACRRFWWAARTRARRRRQGRPRLLCGRGVGDLQCFGREEIRHPGHRDHGAQLH